MLFVYGQSLLRPVGPLWGGGGNSYKEGERGFFQMLTLADKEGVGVWGMLKFSEQRREGVLANANITISEMLI